jgi:ABC-type branched-subunit amino acid transport system ATPase component/ABC-type branched-subunit amino acid transport system permease subunit
VRVAFGILALAVAAAVPLVTANTYYLFVAMLIGITIVVTTGLNVLAGSSGQVSLGQAGFYALGAYTGAILATRLGVGFWTALPAAALLGAAVGVVLGLASLRVSGPYLAMVTIAFGIIVEHGLIEWDALTLGFGGIANIPRPRLGTMGLTLAGYYYVVLVAALASLLLARNLQRSRWGRALVAVRESDIAAESIGLNAYWVRTVAFTLGAAFAGAGGCLYASLAGFVSPDSFTMQASIVFLLVILFGGLGHVLGPVVGALVLIILPELLHRFSDYRLVIYGLLLLGSIYFLPNGVVGVFRRAYARSGAARGAVGPSGPGAQKGEPGGSPFLRKRPVGPTAPRAASERARVVAENVDMRFGGIGALQGVELTLDAGTVHGLIGPNGAGKTTLLNVLSGFYRPTSGHIRLGETDITGYSPHRIARVGIARTFQTTQLFGAMSVVENVQVGLAGADSGWVLGALTGLPATRFGESRLRTEALALLGFVGYTGDPDEIAANLPFGVKRIVEIARALARNPVALLLDEPAAGLSQEEIARLATLIAKIRDGGTGILLVGHHMDLVMGVSDVVTVLNYGRRIAHGPPSVVQRDPAVVEAYLGSSSGDGRSTDGERRGARGEWRTRGREAASQSESESRPPGAPRPSSDHRPAPREVLLDARGLSVAYGRMEVVHDVALEVGRGEVVVVIGANGAGKTTTLKALAGLVPKRGVVRFGGDDVHARPPHWMARHGVALVPEGRMVFADQTVLDNLRLGAYGRHDRGVGADIAAQLDRFPILRERQRQPAGTLSGGEQQMLAIARALMARPRLLLLDEPSLGLAPRLVTEVFAALARLRDEGLTLLLVEQMAEAALEIADRGYVLEQGRIVLSGTADSLRRDERVARAYLGARHGG